MISFDFIVSASHPSIPGHFPGNPIVPGAVIIENVIRAFSRSDDSREITSLFTVKFIKSIEVNQKVDVNFLSISTELISFECISNNVVSVLGRFKVG
jgi:3-hydroxymyristoyl/3-hydroxydecanoyl-(acyl carrier protein) dehydratase